MADRLSPLDVSFLYLEEPTTPMHVGGLAVFQPPEWNRFAHGFSHIFAGGYAAGYYSYLWAERLSADAFEAFAEEGADRLVLGGAFREHVLATGGTRSANENYAAFRGREATNDALLRSWGLAA